MTSSSPPSCKPLIPPVVGEALDPAEWMLVRREAKVDDAETKVEVKADVGGNMLIRGRSSRSRGKGALKGDGKTFSTLSQGMPYMKYKFPDNGIYKFVQMSERAPWLTGSSPANSYIGTAFASTDIVQFSSFSAVFDQYRIQEIEAWIFPVNPSAPTGAAVNRGELSTVIDYDDSNAPSSVAQLQEYQNCITAPGILGQYRRFKPHVATAAYSGVFTSFANMTNQWIDCASTGVSYFALKAAITGADAAGDALVFNLLLRIHVEFRNVR